MKLNLSRHKPIGIILFVIAVVVSIFILSGKAKCQDTVTVTKQFVEDANKAFDLVVEQRNTIQKFLVERATTDVERGQAQALIDSLNKLIAVKDRINDAVDRLAQTFEKVMDIQMKIIDQLEKKLLKPKSFWQKFLDGVKEVLKAATYILIGARLGT